MRSRRSASLSARSGVFCKRMHLAIIGVAAVSGSPESQPSSSSRVRSSSAISILVPLAPHQARGAICRYGLEAGVEFDVQIPEAFADTLADRLDGLLLQRRIALSLPQGIGQRHQQFLQRARHRSPTRMGKATAGQRWIDAVAQQELLASRLVFGAIAA